MDPKHENEKSNQTPAAEPRKDELTEEDLEQAAAGTSISNSSNGGGNSTRRR
jgi:hypothetical protein